MKNPIELKQFGRILADNYLSDSSDLTDGLTKIGAANGLNQYELQRIAEIANVETYLGLFDKKADKYIDFPLANSAKAYEGVVKTAQGKFINNESEDSYKDLSPTFSFSMYDPSFSYDEKPKEDVSMLRKQASKLQDVVTYLGEQFSEESINFKRTVDSIFEMSKQAALGGVLLADVRGIYKSAADNIEPLLTANLITRLSNNTEFMNQMDVEKLSEFTKIPNPDASLYKGVETLGKQFSRLEKIASGFYEFRDKYNYLVSNNNDLHVTNDFKNLDSSIKEFFTTIEKQAGTGLGVVLGAGAVIGANAILDTKKKVDNRFKVNNMKKENVAEILRKQRQGI